MKDTTPEQWRDTGLALVLILLLTTGYTKNFNYVLPAVLATLLTMTWPKFFYPISIFWFAFAHLLGGVVSKIVLALIFFLVVSPVGYLRRAFGHDPMGLKQWKSGSESVFVKREHLYNGNDLKNPF